MDRPDDQARRRRQAQERQQRAQRARLLAIASLVAVAVVFAVIVLSSGGGSGSHHANTAAEPTSQSGHTATSQTATKPGTATVPILAYHVINVAPAGSTASSNLYVPTDEFSAQMDALKAAGWHAVTLDQLEAYWAHGTPLATTKPIVITFDGGFASQYTNALPVLKRLGWVGVANVQSNGLPPSEGGATDAQIRGLTAAGWQLGAEGNTQPDLGSLDPATLTSELTMERQLLRTRYRATVNWFSYPSGRYDPNVTGAVRASGFVGATTLSPGWASPNGDRYLLPRLQVVGGTSPSQLLSQISSAQSNTSPPTTSSGV
jgi:peptidoglycan/xylan/chitin deacetylase (PgdA/CDA1 family)